MDAVEWQIFVRTADGLVSFEDDLAVRCPELGGDITATDLAAECLYRNADNHCEKLDSDCVIRETQ